MKRSPLKRHSKSETSKLQKKCDALLTPIIKKLYPRCLLCGNETQVAHHHVHKSSSNALRYDIKNLINLCSSCHFALHNNESYYASLIVKKKGLRWFNYLEKKKQELVKADKFWYQSHLERLEKLST